MTVSKKTRFEVFKRDSFTCQYCGATAPDVILECDHIEPVSKGGSDDVVNLITSCFDCNRGKSDRRLNDDTVIKKQHEELEQLQERRNQLNMMMLWKKELLNLDNDKVNHIVNYIETFADVEVTEHGRKSIKEWIKKYSLDVLLEAIEDSYSQYEDIEVAFKKIPKIAYYKNKPDAEEHQQMFYLRGILRNRLSYLDESRAIKLLFMAINKSDYGELYEISVTVPSWTAFVNEIEEILERD